MARKFKAFVERPKPRKRPRRHSKTLNNVLSDIGASSTAYTIVDLKNFSGSGTVTFNIEGKNENPIQISANITSSNLSNLVLSINSQSSLTGIKATLSKDKDRNQYSMCYMNRGVEFFIGKSSPRLRA